MIGLVLLILGIILLVFVLTHTVEIFNFMDKGLKKITTYVEDEVGGSK